MKYCPTCGTRYDEEILRFCMKDGTPLVDEEEPNFVAMPSESLDEPIEDEPDEVTVIRRNSVPPPPPDPEPEPKQRIVVPTTEAPRDTRPRAVPYQAPPPKKTNTFAVVLLTVLGTLAVLGIGALGFWFLQNGENDNTNTNSNANQNVNTDVNTNLGIDANFNFNANANFNTNTNSNANANLKTPTPTPTPRSTPSVTPSPSPTRTPDDDDGTPGPSPSPSRSPAATPTPRAPATPSDRPVNLGVLNGRATSLPVPSYPAAARSAGASGRVEVQVTVDERGNITSARAVSGHPLLRSAAESAARNSRISPPRVGDRPVRATGLLLYNFRTN